MANLEPNHSTAAKAEQRSPQLRTLFPQPGCVSSFLVRPGNTSHAMSSINDKPHHRLVTAFFLSLGLAIYFASRFGLFGDRLERFAPYYLVIILCLVVGRAVLTESGVRRKRIHWRRLFD
jgi:hypothetical protein